jgi:hypothetical protein
MIHVKRINKARIQITLTDKSIIRITELVNRGLNTHVGAHPELKELGDMLTEGKILQNYYSQSGEEKTEEE